MTSTGSAKPMVVLVHGAWADASNWSKVIAEPERRRRRLSCMRTDSRRQHGQHLRAAATSSTSAHSRRRSGCHRERPAGRRVASLTSRYASPRSGRQSSPIETRRFAAWEVLAEALWWLASCATLQRRCRGQEHAVAGTSTAPRLKLRQGVLRRDDTPPGRLAPAALATVATESIDLLAGPDAPQLRACYAPGCVLYFVKDHPRREWCSNACGNRSRVARHYAKQTHHAATRSRDSTIT
jgi:hypothetical protein